MVLQENIQNIRPRRPCSLPRSPKLNGERSPKTDRSQRMKVKNISLR
ncbi:unnamed protein product [Oikopleura dioica]|nr:unnamed protein product [Oikopleura dioica]